MAYKQFKKIIEEANVKWSLIDTLIIHRYGKLQVNDKIVLVASFSSHRKDSFEACYYIMDYIFILKYISVLTLLTLNLSVVFKSRHIYIYISIPFDLYRTYKIVINCF